MKISIIVTRYNENWKTCKPLLDSLKMQQGFDFNDLEVVYVNDNDDEFVIEEQYPFSVKVISQGHKGVSSARNFGFDNTTNDFVMFCDCDDMFIELYALHLFSQREEFDIIKSPFVEDQVIDGKLRLIRHDKDTTFNHGKMFKRSFLVENNIRFREDLTIHEDSYFNVLTNIIAGQNQYEMSPAVYLWKYNDNSIVRRDRKLFVFRTYDHLMKCRRAICEELKDRGYITEFYQSVAKTVMDAYYDFQKEDVKEENREIIEKAFASFRDFYKDYEEFFKEININDIARMMYLSRAMSYENGFKYEKQTLEEFLKGNLYIKKR